MAKDERGRVKGSVGERGRDQRTELARQLSWAGQVFKGQVKAKVPLPRHTGQLLTQYYYMYTYKRSVGGGGRRGSEGGKHTHQ